MPPEEMVPGISGANNPAPAKAGQRHSSPATEPGSDRGTLGGPVSAAVIKGGAAGGAADGAEEPPPAATRRRPQADPGADPSVSVPPIPAELTGPQPHPAAVPDHSAGSAVAADGQSSAHGLVICAKSRRAEVDDTTEEQLRAGDAFAPRFPGVDLVTPAAALFERPKQWADGADLRGVQPECGQFRLLIAPGLVKLSWTRPVLLERSSERAATHTHRVNVAAEEAELRSIAAEVDWNDGPMPREPKTSVACREITHWSRKSRANMCRSLAEYDYTPIVGRGRIPAMVTLTYPGDWEVVAPCGRDVKRHLDNWRKRFEREWGEKLYFIWKLEFQRRGAPHFHLWMAPPTAAGKSGLTFRQWCSHVWADVIDHPDPAQRRLHELAGTAVDTLEGIRACDPKRLAIYFTKHSSPNAYGDKEYQHIVPAPWRALGQGPGRFWGAAGLKKVTATVEIDRSDYVKARRIVRRWSRNQAAYSDIAAKFPSAANPRTAILSVPRVDSGTGRVTFRRVRRRRQLCTQGGLAGGFALANNGPEFASQLARALSQWTEITR
ncbi:MAG: hypothetical protein RL091_472 [Verrucomicrobiota bacterium]